MTEKTTIDITPDKSLIQKLGLTGYRTAEAISELLDNSIDARIGEDTERIDVVLDFVGKTISCRSIVVFGSRGGTRVAKGNRL